jgi:hypothetical protein
MIEPRRPDLTPAITSTGFRASFRKAQARADLRGLTFHDIRGAMPSLEAPSLRSPALSAIRFRKSGLSSTGTI